MILHHAYTFVGGLCANILKWDVHIIRLIFEIDQLDLLMTSEMLTLRDIKKKLYSAYRNFKKLIKKIFMTMNEAYVSTYFVENQFVHNIRHTCILSFCIPFNKFYRYLFTGLVYRSLSYVLLVSIVP